MWKWCVLGDFNPKKCAQGFPAFFYVIDQEALRGNVFLDFFYMLIEYLDGISFIAKIAIECSFPDKRLYHLSGLEYLGTE